MTQAVLQSESNDYPIGVFTSEYTGYEAFLADHLIQKQKILPGMAYLEMSRAAVENSVDLNKSQAIVLRDSIFVNALVVTKRRELEIKVYPGSNGEFGVEVSTEQGIHFQTKAYIQDRGILLKEALSSTRTNISELKVDCSKPGVSKEDFYAGFARRGVDLGPSHQGVERIFLGDDCALVKVSIDGSSKRGMVLDPGMLDSVIQGGITLAANPQANVVPFAVNSTLIFSPLKDQMYAYIVRNGEGLDYTVIDEDNNLIVKINGFLSREIDLEAQREQLNFFCPDWEKAEVESQPTDASDLTTTTIEASSDYSLVVSEVFETAKELIQQKVKKHLLEVKLTEKNKLMRGVIAALKTVTAEYPQIETRLRLDGSIYDVNYKAIELEKKQEKVWGNNKNILITGGLGGLGRLLVEDIVSSNPGGKIILVGRSEVDAEQEKILGDFNTNDTQVIYEVCDLTLFEDVKQIIEKHPDINGVIHCAGIIKDNYISKKTSNEVELVLAPKVAGLEYLDQSTAHLKLDYFITFSSIAGALGNVGQFDYSAANGYMDSYIHQRAELVNQKQRHGKSISINWPLWQSDGLQIDEATKKNLLQVFKIKPLSSENGLNALKQIILNNITQAVVVFGNKKSVQAMFTKNTSEPAQKKVSDKSAKQKVRASVKSDKLTREIVQEIKVQTGEHLKLKPNQLNETADWADFGLDSILLSSFVNKVNTRFNLNLMPTVLFEATNIQLFGEYLADNHEQQMAKKLALTEDNKMTRSSVTKAVEVPVDIEPDLDKISDFALGFKKSYRRSVNYRDEDVAVIGMSCKIAGASNPQEFWQMLDEERDMISEIPQDRWDWRDYPGVSKWGSFIEGVTEFDSLFFGISPAEAMYMNPEQRLMMQYVWECIENAGCGGDDVKGNNTGLFIGCGPSGYASLLNGLPIEAYSATGTISSVGPNRISYLMDWHGPSNPIETACSSALVAVHRAVECIRSGQCDMAVAGGVNLLLSPEGYISFSKSGMLCEDGRCKTFSDKANGYVRGEGIGMLMLKSLKLAIKDGNVIHALVKGTAENHGGRTNSLTAPNPKSQAAVIKAAVKDAGIDFSRVSYIECHGTGTSLGDPVEIKGLKTVASELLEDSFVQQNCKLGSIKSNIGHLEYGAGVVGLIKVILQMKHKKIAKSLHCDKLNPYIDLNDSHFEISQQASDWEVAPGQTRVAGVSSFGFGGVNAHVVLEEFNPDSVLNAEDELEEDIQQSQLLVLSAKTEESLFNYVSQFKDFISNVDENETPLKNIAYTLQLGREEMSERIVFVANSIDEWRELVDGFLQSEGKIYDRKICRGSVKGNSSHNFEVGDTQAGQDYIKQLVEDNESEKLAELWVKGTKIDWSVLHS